MTNKKQLKNDRRNFIKKGVAGAAGLSIIPSLNALNFAEKKEQKLKKDSDNKIICRTLGRTGIKVPVVSMGSSSNEYLIRAALNAGIMHLDTANNYRNGQDEATFGRILKDRPRDSFIIATKIIGLRDNGTGMPRADLTPDEFKADFRQRLEMSLKRLQIDYLDILYLHAADNPQLIQLDMIKDVMQEIKDEGKTRFIGVSTHTSNVIYTIVDEKIYDIILVPYNFRQESEITGKAISHAANAGCGIVGMKALAGVYWDSERKQRINPKAALKWILQDENVHTVILSIDNFEQLDTYVSVMSDLNFTPEEKEDLRLGQSLNSPGLFCTQCEQCLPQCPYGVDIPKLMRCYMYAYAYHKPAKAKETLKLVDISKIKCNECSSCDISCKMRFDIRKKITDILRLADVPDEFLV